MLDRELEKRLSMRPKDYQRHIACIHGRFRKVDETPTHIVVGLLKPLDYHKMDDIHLTHITDFYAGYAGDNTSHKTHYSPVYPGVKNCSMYSGFILIEKKNKGGTQNVHRLHREQVQSNSDI